MHAEHCATRRQVRAVVRRESVLMSLLEALTGIGLGTASGIALSRALVDEGVTTVTVPTMTLVIYLAVACWSAYSQRSVRHAGRAKWTSCVL
jgi:hypothetical protein